MIKVYGIPNCMKIQKTLNFFQDNNIKFEFINEKKNPIPEIELKNIVRSIGINDIFNYKSVKFKKFDLEFNRLNEEHKFKLLLKEQSLIIRQLLQVENRYMAGDDEDAIKKFIKK